MKILLKESRLNWLMKELQPKNSWGPIRKHIRGTFKYLFKFIEGPKAHLAPNVFGLPHNVVYLDLEPIYDCQSEFSFVSILSVL